MSGEVGRQDSNCVFIRFRRAYAETIIIIIIIIIIRIYIAPFKQPKALYKLGG